MNTFLTIGELKKAFSDYGKDISDSWIRRQESKGNLIVRKSATNFKRALGYRKPGAVRQFTKDDIEGILIAFLPNGIKLKSGKIATGKGYFNYNNYV